MRKQRSKADLSLIHRENTLGPAMNNLGNRGKVRGEDVKEEQTFF